MVFDALTSSVAFQAGAIEINPLMVPFAYDPDPAYRGEVRRRSRDLCRHPGGQLSCQDPGPARTRHPHPLPGRGPAVCPGRIS